MPSKAASRNSDQREEKDGRPAVMAGNREVWRAWLKEHHTSEPSAWLIIYHKKSSTTSINYAEAVEEAICFGWIDSKPNKRDDQSYYLFFAQRKAKSNWSKANRERVEKMTAEGKMMPAGQAMIDLARESGTWTALVDVQNAVIPDDLQLLFDQDPAALENFMGFAPSSKRIILEWIMNAKRPETREKRLRETVEKAAKGIKANHYRQ